MKNNFALFQNPCRDVAMQRLYIQALQGLYIQIHTSIQQHL
ncbi:hypothetical protein [Nostoc sp. DedQUE02]|nr:hypothetical protein [Nostoc sp. DedQUE03]MDZ7976872.1 hypothetical protein [Nostoc sp. DedQUE03]MDZ8043381.1 hypothetical protein [Nostoc sp. DedQUE02]